MLFYPASPKYLETNTSWRMRHVFQYDLVQKAFDTLQALKAFASPERKHTGADAGL